MQVTNSSVAGYQKVATATAGEVKKVDEAAVGDVKKATLQQDTVSISTQALALQSGDASPETQGGTLPDWPVENVIQPQGGTLPDWPKNQN